MQLRKLIRLLEEAKKQYGDRIEICIDAELVKNHTQLTFPALQSITVETCEWEGRGYEKQILALNIA